ncbi:uncharacterized protein IUM83_03797 [Phytophthora cinnamomi]|uniref:uncharacterized protein n=1 Tax=Phytophthora cinnamomi TaxID=4785 RepID=UPI003559958D|nr:hypothetical protein IUM83_03797 [Phytophthora cinnamomi]
MADDDSSSVRVAVRIRPLIEREKADSCDDTLLQEPAGEAGSEGVTPIGTTTDMDIAAVLRAASEVDPISVNEVAENIAADGPDQAAVVPFFAAVVPPVANPDEWDGFDPHPWPASLRQWTLAAISTLDLKDRLWTLQGWVFPDTPERAPSDWNRELLTVAKVNAVYASEPWKYLEATVVPISFILADGAFAPLVARNR